MAFNRIVLILFGMLAYMNPAAELSATSEALDKYEVPRDKGIIESCRKSALEAIPGKVMSFQAHNTANGFHYRFEIEAKDQVIWEVLCDVSRGKIIRTQQQELE